MISRSAILTSGKLKKDDRPRLWVSVGAHTKADGEARAAQVLASSSQAIPSMQRAI
jgi:hypothetical protein